MLRELIRDIIALPWIILQGRRSCTEDFQKVLKRRAAKFPKALPSRRKEISLSYNPVINASSLLLSKLPLEIRRRIYTYALGSHVVHILSTLFRFAHICCTCPTLTDFTRACCPSARHLFVPKSISIPPSDIAVGLLRTCRRIYAEALSILYSANTFDIDDFSAFAILAGNIPPSGLIAIKSLHLSWRTNCPLLYFAKNDPGANAPFDDATYLRFWEVIANQMPALKELRMAIGDMWWVTKLQVEDLWVQPMKQVKGLDVFEIEVVDPSLRCWEKGQVDDFAAEMRGIVCGRRG